MKPNIRPDISFCLKTACLIFLLCVYGCARPVGVKHIGQRAAYRQLTENALSSNQPSQYSSQLLARLSLSKQFQKDPGGTLAAMHKRLGRTDERDQLFALAELSFLYAMETKETAYYLAAAIYAYAFLFPDDLANDPLPYDPRLRMAMDIYNRSLANGLRAPKSDKVDLSARSLKLPFGSLELSAEPSEFDYGERHLADFISVDDYKIHGLRNHYRRSGIGAPLSARVEAREGKPADRWAMPRSRVPVTAFIRLGELRRSLENGRLQGKLEVHAVDSNPQIVIDGRSIPLEYDPSATLAYGLNGSALWDFELAGFRKGDFTLFAKQQEGELFFVTPYHPGRIPIVLVHGTASSPARWAEMLNELAGDPRIANRYQCWFYIYNSGNPIALSSMHLREELQEAVRGLDPQGRDAALQDMVVIGHSQGGLLTKMTVVSSGSKFWDNVTTTQFAMAKLSGTTKDLLRRTLFVEPLPFVKRVIFISTPHRGSFLTERFIGRIALKFIHLPAGLTQIGSEIIQLNPARAAGTALRIPTSLDNMDWSNPFLKTLSSLPIDSKVTANSIIPVKGKGPFEKGNDGVVRYSSAHIDGVESELVVRSGHSTQANPRTIEEVRRILYEHAGIR